MISPRIVVVYNVLNVLIIFHYLFELRDYALQLINKRMSNN